jgi:DnaJ-class molecular chaperone
MTASGLGMPFHKKDFVYGNLFVKFEVKFPKVLDAKSMEFCNTALSGQAS